MNAYKIITLSPISHGGYNEGIDTGNINMCRQMPVISPTGEIVSAFVISGNAIRGVLRRSLGHEMFNHFDLKNKLSALPAGKYDRLFTAIVNGGTIGSQMDTSVNPEYVTLIRKKIPMLSLLGGAIYRFMMTGMINIGFAYLDCKELGTGDHEIADLITDIGLVRHVDPAINKELAEFKPMPYITESVIKGATFQFVVTFAKQATALEKACFYHGLSQITHLGGKSAVGFGAVEIQGELGDTAPYQEWLRQDPEELIELLIELGGTL